MVYTLIEMTYENGQNFAVNPLDTLVVPLEFLTIFLHHFYMLDRSIDHTRKDISI